MIECPGGDRVFIDSRFDATKMYLYVNGPNSTLDSYFARAQQFKIAGPVFYITDMLTN